MRTLNVIDTYFQRKFWQTQELAGELFIVGDNKFYGKAKNCLLQPKELYEIIVILAESNQSFSESDILKILVHNDEIPSMMRFHEKWIIPIILIIIGTIIALYFYRRWYIFTLMYLKKMETTISLACLLTFFHRTCFV